MPTKPGKPLANLVGCLAIRVVQRQRQILVVLTSSQVCSNTARPPNWWTSPLSYSGPSLTASKCQSPAPVMAAPSRSWQVSHEAYLGILLLLLGLCASGSLSQRACDIADQVICDAAATCILDTTQQPPAIVCTCKEGNTGTGRIGDCQPVPKQECPLRSNLTALGVERTSIALRYVEDDLFTYRCLSGLRGRNGKTEFSSRCQPGAVWFPALAICTDVDECTEGSHNCAGDRVKCVNTYRSFQCNCPIGTRIINIGGTVRCSLTDFNCSVLKTVNGAWSYHPDNNNALLVPIGTRATLECSTGHTLLAGFVNILLCGRPMLGSWATDEQTLGLCQDTNECLVRSDACAHRPRSVCQNTEGSYSCNCPAGMQLAQNSCQAILTTTTTTTTSTMTTSTTMATVTSSGPTSPAAANQSSEDGDNTYVIVAILCGTILVVALSSIIAYLLHRIAKQRGNYTANPEEGPTGNGGYNLEYGDPRDIHIHKPAPPDYANVVGSKQLAGSNSCLHSNNLTGFKYPLTMETMLVDADTCSQATLSNLGSGRPVPAQGRPGHSGNSAIAAYSTKALVFPSLSAPPSVRPPPVPSTDTSGTVRYHNNDVESFVRVGSQSSILESSPNKSTAPPLRQDLQGPQLSPGLPAGEKHLTHADSPMDGNGHRPLRKERSPYERPIDDDPISIPFQL